LTGGKQTNGIRNKNLSARPPTEPRRRGEEEPEDGGSLYQEADGALVEVGARVVGARVAGRELGLVDEAAQLPQVDVRVRVQALRPRVPLLHRRPPPPPADPVAHPATAPQRTDQVSPPLLQPAAAAFPSTLLY